MGKLYYSAASRGFFDADLHGPDRLPVDAVEITPARHRHMLEQQSAGMQIVGDARGAPIAVARVRSVDEIKAGFVAAVQARLDAQARAMGYDSIFTAVTYADEPLVAAFQVDGRALRAWRSAVWALCYKLLDDVQQGRLAMPTEAELVAMLPAFGALA